MSEAQGKKATRGLWDGTIIGWVCHFLFITGGTPGVKTWSEAQIGIAIPLVLSYISTGVHEI